MISGMTYICESEVSPTKNVLVLIVPSNTGMSVEPVDVKNSYKPLPLSVAVKLALVWKVYETPSTEAVKGVSLSNVIVVGLSELLIL